MKDGGIIEMLQKKVINLFQYIREVYAAKYNNIITDIKKGEMASILDEIPIHTQY